MSIALVFPGQGSQSVGMLAALARRFPDVRRCYEEASAALGYDLWQLVCEGPVQRLDATEFTQPAMLAAGVATWRVWLRQGGARPALVSGHSLGEFTALVCAETLPFAPALQLVRYRGQIMQAAIPEDAGAMAAIIGLTDATVEALCREAAREQVVEAVNFNSPGQVVIAGDAVAVARALELARSRGARRAVPLPVSVPAHSSLMRKAAQQLRQRLAQVPLSAPRCTYISAVDARAHADPEDLRATLVRQLASPVRWTDTVRVLLKSASILIECGPGKVLTGLNRRIERAAGCFALEDPAAFDAALQAAAANGAGGARGDTAVSESADQPEGAT